MPHPLYFFVAICNESNGVLSAELSDNDTNFFHSMNIIQKWPFQDTTWPLLHMLCPFLQFCSTFVLYIFMYL